MKGIVLPQIFQLDAWFHLPAGIIILAWYTGFEYMCPFSLYSGGGFFCICHHRTWHRQQNKKSIPYNI